jgi:hypothetical protein
VAGSDSGSCDGADSSAGTGLRGSEVTSVVATMRAVDHVLKERIEIYGMDPFEEVVNLDDLVTLKDPFKEQPIELAKGHGE